MAQGRVERLIGWAAVAGGLVASAGCGRTSSILLERHSRGPMEEEREIAHEEHWVAEPVTQTQSKDGLDITVTFAARNYLREFFANKRVFGNYAGMNPFFGEQMIFYVKIANKSGKKVRINPDEFVLLDDLGNQYQTIGVDYANALAEMKAPVATLTRGVVEEARPGYFGVGLPVGKIIGKPQQRYALIKMSSLQAGYLFDGVIYDGLITFWSPHENAKHLKLLLTNMKTDFEANDFPKTSLEFTFEFTSSKRK